MFLGPETSQETLKKPKSRPRSTQRDPKVVQNLVKKWPKSEPKNEQKKWFPRGKKSLWPASLGAAFEAMGPSKNAYFEDV